MTPVAVAVRWPLLIILMNTLSVKPPLQHVCLLRLSAIGDTCHALAALRAFQAAWPETRFTWIIGKVEAKLMTAIVPDVEFIITRFAPYLQQAAISDIPWQQKVAKVVWRGSRLTIEGQAYYEEAHGSQR